MDSTPKIEGANARRRRERFKRYLPGIVLALVLIGFVVAVVVTADKALHPKSARSGFEHIKAPAAVT